MKSSFLLLAAGCLGLAGAGCNKLLPSKPAPTTKPPAITPSAAANRKVKVKINDYIPMSKVSGRVVASESGAINLAICTVKEWARCKVEKRPPIPSETVTVLFGDDHQGEFIFERSDLIVPPFFVFSPKDSEFRIDPVMVGK